MNPQITISITASPEGSQVSTSGPATSSSGLPEPSTSHVQTQSASNGSALPRPELDAANVSASTSEMGGTPSPRPLQELAQAASMTGGAPSSTGGGFAANLTRHDGGSLPSPMPLEQLEREAGDAAKGISTSPNKGKGGKSSKKGK